MRDAAVDVVRNVDSDGARRRNWMLLGFGHQQFSVAFCCPPWSFSIRRFAGSPKENVSRLVAEISRPPPHSSRTSPGRRVPGERKAHGCALLHGHGHPQETRRGGSQRLLTERQLGTRLRPASFAVTGKPRRLKTVPVAGAELVFLHLVAHQFYRDRAPARVGIGLGVVA